MNVFSGDSQDFIDTARESEDKADKAFNDLEKAYRRANYELVRSSAVLARSIVFPNNQYTGFKLNAQFIQEETGVSAKIILWQAKALFELIGTANDVIAIVDSGNYDGLSYAIEDLMGDLLAVQGFGENIDDFVDESHPILNEHLEEQRRNVYG